MKLNEPEGVSQDTCPAVFGCFSLSRTENKKFRELHFPEYILVSPDASFA